MPPAFKTKEEAQAGLTASFNPTNETQRQAIAQASALVPITPSALNPTQPITPVVPQQRPITTPAFDLTPDEAGAEQGVRTGMSDIGALLGDLAGENTFRAEQQQAQDIIGKRSAISSFQNQLRSLQSQGQGIQLQLQQDFQNLQNQIQRGGANVTRGGIDPQRRAIQTQANQQLLSNAIQQYSVGAQLSAAQGDYTTALQYVDEAVNLKFQGKKDQLAAAQANLELLLKSPDLTSAQEKRALARQQALKQEEREIERQERQETEIQDLALKAIVSGADALIVRAIQSSKTTAEAMEVLAQSGLLVPQAEERNTQVMKLDNGNTVLIDTQTGEVIKNLGGAASSTGNVPSGNLSTTGKPFTEGERVAQGYAKRLEEANTVIDEIGSKFSGLMSYGASNLPNFLKSSDRQSFEQAQRNFINAVLRKESGAVISDSEFDNARKQYFPQPGDGSKVLEQKAQNRLTALNSMRTSGGLPAQEKTISDTLNDDDAYALYLKTVGSTPATR